MSTSAVNTVQTALRHTLKARTARITYTVDHSWGLRKSSETSHVGWFRRLATNSAKLLGKGLLHLLTGGVDIRHQTAEGVLDLDRRRSMIDYGSYASTQVEDRHWSGRSGRLLSTMTGEPARVATPLWLIDLMAGIITAEETTTEEPDPRTPRHFAVTINLASASAATRTGMASPAQDRFETLYRLTADVWLDDTHLRQVRFVHGTQTCTLALSEFGTDINSLEWTRLSTLRSPKERSDIETRRAGTSAER